MTADDEECLTLAREAPRTPPHSLAKQWLPHVASPRRQAGVLSALRWLRCAGQLADWERGGTS
jgi:hypothetical protein